MRVTMKYAYPEKGTKNRRIYPPEVEDYAENLEISTVLNNANGMIL